jgi:hypothetical protein
MIDERELLGDNIAEISNEVRSHHRYLILALTFDCIVGD